MQGGRQVRENTNTSDSPFDSGFGFGGFSSMFGTRRDPFDDPFFTRPFGSLFRSRTFSSDGPSHMQYTEPKALVIEEVDSDEEAKTDENDIRRNTNPSVEHPEDQVNDRGNNSGNGREISYSTNSGKPGANHQRSRSVSYQRVTYGGISGPYYTSTTSRRTGNDGVTVEESRKADRTTGQATHRVSRGLHNKGHSVTRKLDSDGKVDTVHTLHNLNEDELEGFEQAWRSNGDRFLGDWNGAFDFPGNSGRRQRSGLSSWAGHSAHRNLQAQSSRGRSKKVVSINIE